jgi:RNA polymerase sigma-70 factor (ECF subfamily)
MTDTALIASLRAGNQSAFTTLVETHQSAVYNLCYRMLGEAREAEDATQETFLRAYSQLRRYDAERPFKTWLLAIASHHCIDRLRRRRQSYLSLDDDLLAEREAWRAATPDPQDVAVRREACNEVAAMLASLAPKDRIAIVLHYWYGLSYEEIAGVVGSSVGAVKSRLHRARLTLGSMLRQGSGGREAVGRLRTQPALAG